jgi:hypothetical protein
MKNLLLFFFVCIYSAAYCQDTIRIDLQNNEVEKQIINLPATFIIENFGNKTVSILDENKQKITDIDFIKPDSISFSIDACGRIFNVKNPINIKSEFYISYQTNTIPFTVSNPVSCAPDNPPIPNPKIDWHGYIYDDAVFLAKNINNKDSVADYPAKQKLLDLYRISETVNNPYLKDIYEKVRKPGDISGKGAQDSSPKMSLLSSLGNTDVTYFATGLSRFLAERTKEELNAAFFDKMKKELDKYPELQIVFPQTHATMQHIDSYGYAYIIQILKDAFEADMRSLPQNFYSFSFKDNLFDCNSLSGKDSIECEKRQRNLTEFFNSPDGKWLTFGLSTLNKAFNATNPADLLQSVVSDSLFINLKNDLVDSLKKNSTDKISLINDYNVLSFLQLSNLISQSLLSKESDKVWITKQQLDTLFQPETFKIYLGLLLATVQKDDIYFYKNTTDFILTKEIRHSFSEILTDTTKISAFQSLIQNGYSVYNAGNNAVKSMKEAINQSKDADSRALYDFYRAFTNNIRPIANNISNITERSIHLAKYERIENILNPAVDMVYHIADKNYSSAIFDATILLENLSTEDSFKPVTKSLLKYGTLIANVANAQSSDEVKKAIEASVLPVGSSAIKRNTSFSIMLNAYVGGFYGWRKGLYGVTAPIGLSFNTGFKGNKNDGAFSVDIQLIDLGTLVNFYLKNGDDAELPTDYKVNLANIFSPGFQMGYLIPSTPIQVFWGGNYIPALKQTNAETNTYQGGWRWKIGLAMDIPMYNIYTK